MLGAMGMAGGQTGHYRTKLKMSGTVQGGQRRTNTPLPLGRGLLSGVRPVDIESGVRKRKKGERHGWSRTRPARASDRGIRARDNSWYRPRPRRRSCLHGSGPRRTIHDIPTHRLKRGGKAKREVDLTELARILDAGASTIAHFFLEQAGAMPRQGVTSMFSFGKVYGAILGIVAANFLPLTLVHPTRWKRAMGVPKAKDGARARASQLLPRAAGNWSLVKHDGRAEAALIALYGRRELART